MRFGVWIHFKGGWPDYEHVFITEMHSPRPRIHFVVATSILAVGVNLRSINNVLLKARRVGDNPYDMEPGRGLELHELQQMMGRAARYGPGHVFTYEFVVNMTETVGRFALPAPGATLELLAATLTRMIQIEGEMRNERVMKFIKLSPVPYMVRRTVLSEPSDVLEHASRLAQCGWGPDRERICLLPIHDIKDTSLVPIFITHVGVWFTHVASHGWPTLPWLLLNCYMHAVHYVANELFSSLNGTPSGLGMFTFALGQRIESRARTGSPNHTAYRCLLDTLYAAANVPVAQQTARNVLYRTCAYMALAFGEPRHWRICVSNRVESAHRTAKKAVEMGASFLAYIDWALRDPHAPVPPCLHSRTDDALSWLATLRTHVERDIAMMKAVDTWVVAQQKCYAEFRNFNEPVHPPEFGLFPSPAVAWARHLAVNLGTWPVPMATNVDQDNMMIHVFRSLQENNGTDVPAEWGTSLAYPEATVDLWFDVVAGLPLNAGRPCVVQMPKRYRHVFYWIAQHGVSPCVPFQHGSYILLSDNAATRAPAVQDRGTGGGPAGHARAGAQPLRQVPR
jgi:hypothetical protein